MYQVEDEPIETIHLYVVREGQKRPSLAPVIISFLALIILIAFGLLLPYQQPEVRRDIRVPAILLPLKTFTAEVTVIPTGIKTYPATQAHGILTITNGSVIAQELPKGLIFTGNNGFEVVTDEAVFIPAGSAAGYGFATVSAHAIKAGKLGNIPAFVIDSVEGSSVYIRNLQPFTDGSDAYSVKFQTTQDRQNALIEARVNLKHQAVSGLLYHPCVESVSGTTILTARWICQFLRYNVPHLPGVKVLHVSVAGKTIILSIVFVERPRIFPAK